MTSILASAALAALLQYNLAAPTPVPASTYTDPAMTFVAPAGYERVPVPPNDPSNFSQRTVMAAWVKDKGQRDQSIITISMENFSGTNVADYAGQQVSSLRQAGDSGDTGGGDTIFVEDRETAKLQNGMPAYFVQFTTGSGLGMARVYEVMWVDGVRAVTLSLAAHIDEIDVKTARAALSDCTAVAYPTRTQP